ncbi:MAG: alpha/beta hydrolase [Dehalococcoidia bacterium]|nr:alpha/beta hydrolase [Dehalococcoidia bacterium]
MAFDPALELNIRFANRPKSASVNSAGLKINYLEWGDPSSPTLLLLHGFTSHAHCWDFLADALCAKYRLIALDLPGHGDSDWSKRGYSVSIFRKALDSFCDQMKLQSFSLLGMSLGGMIGMDFASRYPQRLNKLIIVDAGPKVPNGGRRDQIVQFFGGRSRFTSTEDAFVYRRSQESRCIEYMERYLTYYAVKQMRDGSWTWKFDSLFRNPLMLLLKTQQPNLWECLPDIKCPVLLLNGELSMVLKSDAAKKMAELIPDCRLVTFKDTAHRIHIERPQEFEDQVSAFLQSPKGVGSFSKGSHATSIGD